MSVTTRHASGRARAVFIFIRDREEVQQHDVGEPDSDAIPHRTPDQYGAAGPAGCTIAPLDPSRA